VADICKRRARQFERQVAVITRKLQGGIGQSVQHDFSFRPYRGVASVGNSLAIGVAIEVDFDTH
jgi:hypothetical protein